MTLRLFSPLVLFLLLVFLIGPARGPQPGRGGRQRRHPGAQRQQGDRGQPAGRPHPAARRAAGDSCTAMLRTTKESCSRPMSARPRRVTRLGPGGIGSSICL